MTPSIRKFLATPHGPGDGHRLSYINIVARCQRRPTNNQLANSAAMRSSMVLSMNKLYPTGSAGVTGRVSTMADIFDMVDEWDAREAQ
jgi:hypothetical protein